MPELPSEGEPLLAPALEVASPGEHAVDGRLEHVLGELGDVRRRALAGNPARLGVVPPPLRLLVHLPRPVPGLVLLGQEDTLLRERDCSAVLEVAVPRNGLEVCGHREAGDAVRSLSPLPAARRRVGPLTIVLFLTGLGLVEPPVLAAVLRFRHSWWVAARRRDSPPVHESSRTLWKSTRQTVRRSKSVSQFTKMRAAIAGVRGAIAAVR